MNFRPRVYEGGVNSLRKGAIGGIKVEMGARKPPKPIRAKWGNGIEGGGVSAERMLAGAGVFGGMGRLGSGGLTVSGMCGGQQVFRQPEVFRVKRAVGDVKPKGKKPEEKPKEETRAESAVEKAVAAKSTSVETETEVKPETKGEGSEREKEKRLAEFLGAAERVVARDEREAAAEAEGKPAEDGEGERKMTFEEWAARNRIEEEPEVQEKSVTEETAAVFPELPFGDNKSEGEAKQEGGWRKKRRKRKHRH